MDRAAILTKVIEVTEDTLSLGDDVTLTEDTNLKELGADSFDLLELVTALEDEFSMTFADDAVGTVLITFHSHNRSLLDKNKFRILVWVLWGRKDRAYFFRPRIWRASSGLATSRPSNLARATTFSTSSALDLALRPRSR